MAIASVKQAECAGYGGLNTGAFADRSAGARLAVGRP